MRDYATSWLIKIILGAIVVVFVFWGVGSFRNRKANIIASVNGDAITLEEYRSSYNTLLDQMRQRFGNSLNEDLLKMLQLDQQALNQLIEKRLILQEVARLNFRVTDEEVIRSIQSIPAFQTDGVFDGRLYATILNFNRMTPEIFEAAQKESLLMEKLRTYLFSGFRVSENELKEYFNWKNATVSIDYVLFDPKTYTDIELTKEAIDTYFNENKESYKTDPLRKAQYLFFDPKDYKADVQISDEAIQNYYLDHKNDYASPKTVEARHILFKLESGADDQAVAAAKARAETVLDLIQKGADFAEMAKIHSEGPSKTNGGHLGTFRKEDMVAPFSEKAFSMQAGEISEPVQTQFGWHLIKVEKVNPASEQTLEEATDAVRKVLANEEAKVLAYDKAEAFYESTLEGDDIAQVAAELGLAVKTTGPFSNRGPDKGIANPRGFADAAFALSGNQISDIIDLKDGYYILQVIESIPSKIPELAAVKKSVEADLLKDMQATLAEEDANDFLEKLKNTGQTEASDASDSGTFKSTDYFKRSEQIPDIGWDNAVSQEAFLLSSENPLPDNAIKGQKGFYVVRLKARRLPDALEFDKEKQQLQETLVNQKKSKVFNAWLADARERSDITIREEFQQ
jgi:peptidyl-prolyl cis-trans isomerase D